MISLNDDRAEAPCPKQSNYYQPEFPAPRHNIQTNKIVIYVPLMNEIGENSCYVNVVLHFLSHIPLLSSYISNSLLSSNNKLLLLLHSFIDKYNKYKRNDKILDSKQIRKQLLIESKGKFVPTKTGDPIELIEFLFSVILPDDVGNQILHKLFYIELKEVYLCNLCKAKKELQFDKDFFIYSVTVNEIMEYISFCGYTYEFFNSNLFSFLHETNHQDAKTCEKCKVNMIKEIINSSISDYLLINCAWNNSPSLQSILSYYFLISLQFQIDKGLFDECIKDNVYSYHKLIGMFLYSNTAYHYITSWFGEENNKWVLYNDEKILTFKDYEELVKFLMKDLKYPFYPVLLIYQRINSNGAVEYKEIRHSEIMMTEIQKNIDEYIEQKEQDQKIRINRYILKKENNVKNRYNSIDNKVNLPMKTNNIVNISNMKQIKDKQKKQVSNSIDRTNDILYKNNRLTKKNYNKAMSYGTLGKPNFLVTNYKGKGTTITNSKNAFSDYGIHLPNESSNAFRKNTIIIRKTNNSFNKGNYYAQKRNNIKKYKVI